MQLQGVRTATHTAGRAGMRRGCILAGSATTAPPPPHTHTCTHAHAHTDTRRSAGTNVQTRPALGSICLEARPGRRLPLLLPLPRPLPLPLPLHCGHWAAVRAVRPPAP